MLEQSKVWLIDYIQLSYLNLGGWIDGITLVDKNYPAL